MKKYRVKYLIAVSSKLKKINRKVLTDEEVASDE